MTPTVPVEATMLRRDEHDRTVELVWMAPPQPEAVRFYVEVVAIDGPGEQPAYAGYAPASALLVPLPGAGRYAWRVYVVGVASRTYVPTAWQRFAVLAPAPRSGSDRLAQRAPNRG